MRAGSTGSQKYSTMMWAGDQNVDWSLDDGLASVVPAALSLAMTGHGLHHSDIGGYTTLFEMKRSKELLLRWCDFSAFTPMMRTHEGNRPGDNWQFDGDAETIAHFARMTTVFTHPETLPERGRRAECEVRPAGYAPAVPALRRRRADLHPEISVPVRPRHSGRSGA